MALGGQGLPIHGLPIHFQFIQGDRIMGPARQHRHLRQQRLWLRLGRHIQAIPTPLVVGLAVLLISAIALWVDRVPLDHPGDLLSRPALGALLASAEAIALVAAAILYFKEAPDRQAQKHYEAWQVIDHAAAAQLPSSYARRKALQDLYADGVSLTGVDLAKADLKGLVMPGVDLTGADLSRTDCQGVNFQQAVLKDANLLKANFKGADLQGADLSFARLMEAQLQWVKLRGASLQGAKLMAIKAIGAELSQADLCWSDLQNAQLMGAKLQGANLKGAKLQGANLMGAKLAGADLRSLTLQGVQLQGADLTRARLPESGLAGALLCKTILPDGQVSDRDCEVPVDALPNPQSIELQNP